MKVDISFIIPVYNAEKYIERNIKSILCQEIENYEIILVNDGSTDNSLSIMNQMYSHNKTIRIFNQKNKGVSAARNLGIENASGDYIMFLDADDFLVENSINVLLKLAIKRKSDITIGDIKILNDKKYNVKRNNCLEHEISYEKEELIKIFFKDECPFDCYSSCAKLFSKKIYSKLRFAEGRNSNEDRYYFFQSVCLSDVIVYKNKVVYLYEKHPNSLSTSKADKRLFDNIYFSDKMTSYIRKKEMCDINFAIYNQLLTYMMVYRNFYRDKKAYKKYQKELKKLREKILNFNVNCKIKKIRKIELFIIKYFNFIYYFFVNIFDRIMDMVN